MPTNDSTYNLQTKTRFIFKLPIEEAIGKYASLNDFRLNVQGFSTPEISVGINNTSYKGYSIPIPNGVRSEEKTLTIRFLVSETLIQYVAMLKWMNQITAFDSAMDGASYSPAIASANASNNNILSAASLWTLDSYLKPNQPITYSGLFISRLGQLIFDQADQDGGIMTCDASFSYFKSDFNIDAILGTKLQN